MKTFTRKFFNLFLKTAIAGLLVWAIYRQVFAQENVSDLWETFTRYFTYPNLFWLLAVVCLAPLNLALEALKWQQLIKNFSNLGFGKTFQAILAGTTIAIFTPNRVGEYGGRVLFVKKEQGWKAVIATMVGSLSQLLALLSAGLAGAVYFSVHYLEPEPYIIPVVILLGACLIGLLFFTFFNIDLVVPIAKRIPHIDKIKKYLRHLAMLKHYRSNELGRALLYAFLRYFTYSFQYYLLLQFYDIPAPLLTGLAGIATIFLVQASVPLPPLMGLLARGEIALYVWGFFAENQVNILAATFSLFVINIAVPALLGLFFIIQVNIAKFLGYENGGTS